MSFKEVGWVLDHSPYALADRLVHIVLAERANEDHDWELWYSVNIVAVKAGVSRRTVERSLAKMVEDKYLAVIEDSPGRPTRYRFLMPTYDNLSHPHPATYDIQSAKPTTSTDYDLLLPKEDKNREFDSFYAVFPLHRAPDAARRAWDKALKRGATAEEIIAGAERYRDDPGRSRDPHYIAHPATWLNAGRWKDEVESQESTEQKYAPLRLDASEL